MPIDPIIVSLRRAPSRWMPKPWRAEYTINTVSHTEEAWTASGAIRKARRDMLSSAKHFEWFQAVTGNKNPVIAETIARLRMEPEVSRAE